MISSAPLHRRRSEPGLKIYVMTDLEGVAGVLDFHNWCHPSGRYYEVAKELLTREVNAAVRGFRSAGAAHIVVADGHGHGGIDPRLLHPDAELMRGWPDGYPLNLDDTFDAVAWVGQHAKAGTEQAHLAHTGSFRVLDFAINGVSVGEFGKFAMCAGELGIRSIFASGDQALAAEARALIPGIETAAVKRGLRRGTGDDLSAEDYSRWNEAAVHAASARAREMIYEAARRAVLRAAEEDFGIVQVAPPFEKVVRLRPESREEGSGVTTHRVSDAYSVARVLNSSA